MNAFEACAGPITGAEKVAAILLAVDRERASRLFQHFDREELKIVARAAAGLAALSATEMERLFSEFTADWTSGAELRGGAEGAHRLLSSSLPSDEASQILAEALGTQDCSIWDKLSREPVASVAGMIDGERPHVAAYILANLPPQYAGSMIAELPIERRSDLLALMIAAPVTTEPMRRLIEDSLEQRILSGSAKHSGQDAISRIAGILNTFEAAEIETIVRKIESARPVEARELRKMLFSFDDVPRLSKQALSLLFDRLSTDVVVRALVGTDAEFRDTVLSCLASRARRLVESELTTTGTVSQSEVSKARRSITELVLRMAQKNEIELPSSNTPDEPEA